MRLGALALALLIFAAAPKSVTAEGGYTVLQGNGGPVKGMAISEDGRYALTASFDYSVGLWDLSSHSLLRWLEGHEAAANAVAFLPDGRRAISAGDDFDLILWDLATGAALRRM